MPLYTLKPTVVNAYKILAVLPLTEGGDLPLQVHAAEDAPALHVPADAIPTIKMPEVGDYVILGDEETLAQIVKGEVFERRFMLTNDAAPPIPPPLAETVAVKPANDPQSQNGVEENRTDVGEPIDTHKSDDATEEELRGAE